MVMPSPSPAFLKTGIRVLIKPLNDSAMMPIRATADSIGYDVASAQGVTIPPRKWRAVATGFAMEMPPGYEAQLRPRSGLALKFGVTLLNAPATIDPDYRGEVKVLLVNHGTEEFVVTAGMRIAQLVFASRLEAQFSLTTQLGDSDRGSSGFGHSGT